MSRMRQLEIRTRRMVDDSAGRRLSLGVQGPGHGFRRSARVQPRRRGAHDRLERHRARRQTFVKKYTEERELTIFLLVDISASGNFGSSVQPKREFAAELAGLLAFSAIRNSDKVGLLLYTDRVERYLPPKKGSRHVLRVVRDVLCHAPEGIATDTPKALDVVNRVLHRRAIVFLLSDFVAPGDQTAARAQLRRALRQTNRRHDLIAVQIEDPRERELPDVGIVALEDAETGEVVELDTGSAKVRRRFAAAAQERSRRLLGDFRAEGVDALQLRTDQAYLPALQRLFKNRERRRA